MVGRSKLRQTSSLLSHMLEYLDVADAGIFGRGGIDAFFRPPVLSILPLIMGSMPSQAD